MLGTLKKTAYRLVLIGLIIFAGDTYIDFKIKKLFEDFKTKQTEKVTTVKENLFNAGFFN